MGLSDLEKKPVNEIYAFYQFVQFLDEKIKTDKQTFVFYNILDTWQISNISMIS